MNDQLTIIEFLKARLAEDETAAMAATPGPWEWDGFDREYRSRVSQRVTTGTELGDEVGSAGDRDARHIIRHNPARVLREVAAKRVIVAEYEAAVRRKKAEWENYADWVDGNARGPRPSFEGPDPKLIPGLERSARHLAAVYSDHPDYDQSWSSG